MKLHYTLLHLCRTEPANGTIALIKNTEWEVVLIWFNY